MGRSRARNKGLEESQSKWVFFLDADDVMHPDCFRNFETGYEAVFGQISELVQGTVKWRYQVPEITSFQELVAFDPYLTLQMGHFVRREVAKSIGFDESMDTGEDWKYYLELWKKHRCVKINKPLFINSRGNHSTGPRSATGQDWREVVNGLIAEARND
jgi:glycosyltransferase involved in cell wall biosynthesis